jgi:hypothetical protein
MGETVLHILKSSFICVCFLQGTSLVHATIHEHHAMSKPPNYYNKFSQISGYVAKTLATQQLNSLLMLNC